MQNGSGAAQAKISDRTEDATNDSAIHWDQDQPLTSEELIDKYGGTRAHLFAHRSRTQRSHRPVRVRSVLIL